MYIIFIKNRLKNIIIGIDNYILFVYNVVKHLPKVKELKRCLLMKHLLLVI